MVATFTAKNVVQQGNKLSMEPCFSDPDGYNTIYRSTYDSSATTFTTHEYLINCLVRFQAKVIRYYKTLMYFVHFTKKHTSDDLTYILEYTHTLDYPDNNDKRGICFTLDSGCWQLVDKLKVDRCSWNITLVLSPKTAENPCATLYNDTELTDLELRGVDGSVYLHKAIAAAFSPVIKTGLTGEWGKLENPVMDAPPDTTEAALLQFKQYMYTGVLPDTDVKELLLLASFYMISDLEQRCVQELLKEVTPEQAYHLVEFAMKHQMTALVFGIRDYVSYTEWCPRRR